MPDISVRELRYTREQLETIYESLPHIETVLTAPIAVPIIDATLEHDGAETDILQDVNGASTSIPGLKAFRSRVKSDIELIDRHLHLAKSTNKNNTTDTDFTITSPSTNAPYLIAVWNELVCAQGPVTAIGEVFGTGTKHLGETNKNGKRRPITKSVRKDAGVDTTVKVDIVAEGDGRWIRVNTIKNSRLLAEFREQDSYLTDSDSEGVGTHDSIQCISLAGTGNVERTAFNNSPLVDNSLIRMGKALIKTAQATSGPCPEVTLRLTRLQLSESAYNTLQSQGLRSANSYYEHQFVLPSAEDDPRIALTVQSLLEMGVDVVLGEHHFQAIPGIPLPPEFPSLLVPDHAAIAAHDKSKSFSGLHNAGTPQWIPSREVGLDLSVIIALISDLTHAPLPLSADDAVARFMPNPTERARSQKRREEQKRLLAAMRLSKDASSKHNPPNSRKKADQHCDSSSSSDATNPRVGDAKIEHNGDYVHSRALAAQASKEMELGLLDELAKRLGICVADTQVGETEQGEQSFPLTFWTTRKARDRCLRIVDKVGGPGEKRRAKALFYNSMPATPDAFDTLEKAEDAYWLGSRYKRTFLPIVPIRIFEEEGMLSISPSSRLRGTESKVSSSVNPFWVQLKQTCERLLSHSPVPHPRSLALIQSISMDHDSSQSVSSLVPTQIVSDNNKPEPEIGRAGVTRDNSRLTEHTVETLWWGATRLRTTLTANRGSVREMLKECNKDAKEAGLKGRHSRATSLAEYSADFKDCEEMHDPYDSSPSEKDGWEKGATESEEAVIWIVDPRSLAESMRSDYVS